MGSTILGKNSVRDFPYRNVRSGLQLETHFRYTFLSEILLLIPSLIYFLVCSSRSICISATNFGASIIPYMHWKPPSSSNCLVVY